MQETRKKFDNTPAYNYVNKLRETETHGGGNLYMDTIQFFLQRLIEH